MKPNPFKPLSWGTSQLKRKKGYSNVLLLILIMGNFCLTDGQLYTNKSSVNCEKNICGNEIKDKSPAERLSPVKELPTNTGTFFDFNRIKNETRIMQEKGKGNKGIGGKIIGLNMLVNRENENNIEKHYIPKINKEIFLKPKSKLNLTVTKNNSSFIPNKRISNNTKSVNKKKYYSKIDKTNASKMYSNDNRNRNKTPSNIRKNRNTESQKISKNIKRSITKTRAKNSKTTLQEVIMNNRDLRKLFSINQNENNGKSRKYMKENLIEPLYKRKNMDFHEEKYDFKLRSLLQSSSDSQFKISIDEITKTYIFINISWVRSINFTEVEVVTLDQKYGITQIVTIPMQKNTGVYGEDIYKKGNTTRGFRYKIGGLLRNTTHELCVRAVGLKIVNSKSIEQTYGDICTGFTTLYEDIEDNENIYQLLTVVIVLAISSAIMIVVMIFVAFEKFFEEKKEELILCLKCKRRKKIVFIPKGKISPEPITIKRPRELEDID